MRISKVRDYIISRITDQDSDFKEWKDGFNYENIPRNLFNKSFHITYGVPSIESRGDHNIHNVAATVRMFFKGFRNPQEALDTAMDLSNLIGLNIQSQAGVALYRATDDFPIQKVDFISQSVEPLQTNDNAIIITLELELAIIQTIC